MVTYRAFRWIDRSIKYMDKSIEILRHKYGYCPRCGGILLVRNGEYGKFLGCTNYPKCKYTQNI